MEPMFSDFKSRGFGITKTNLQHEDRIERLISVLTIALYWSVSTGMRPKSTQEKHTKKAERSVTSFFKVGLRFILNAALYLSAIPKLWSYINYVCW